jgi:hypothetical protein
MNVEPQFLSVLSILATILLGGVMAYNATKKASSTTPLREQVTQLHEQVEDLSTRNDALQRTLVSFQTELTETRVKLAAAEKRAADLQAVVDRLQADSDRNNYLISSLLPRNVRRDGNLYSVLVGGFNDVELKELAFNLGVDIEQIAGTAKSEKALELIGYFERRKQLAVLTAAVQKARPNANLG